MNASDQPPGRAGALARATLPWLVMVAAFVHALTAGWRKWGNLLIDTGRELDVPRRLSEGQLLYRDAFFNYGPLAPYANALLYKIFGVHLDVLVWAGIASAALFAGALYRLARFFVPRGAAAAVVIAFVYLGAFGHLTPPAIFNFVLPYSFSATYGIVAAGWSLVFLIDHVRSGRRARFYLSVGGLTLAALSKLEPLVPVAAAHAVFLVAAWPSRPALRRTYAAGYGTAAAVLGAVYGAFSLSVGPGLWSENLAGVVNPGSKRFVAWVAGFSDPKHSLEASGISAAMLAAAWLAAWAIGRWLSRRGAPVAVAWGAVAGLALAAFFGYRYWQLHVYFRTLPFVMAGVLVALTVLYFREPERRDEWLTHGILWVFGFACLWRIPLNAKPQHYGFYLLPAGLVCLAVLVFDYGPRLAGGGVWPARAFGASGLGLVAAAVTVGFADSRQHDLRHTDLIETRRGSLCVANDARLLVPMIEALAALPPTTRLVTVPQGAGILFLSGLKEGDSMDHFLPMDVYGPAADARLLSRWKGNPPDLVLWVGLSLNEFDSRGFGVDYAQRAMAWVLQNYVPLTNPKAFFVLMQYRGKRPALIGPAGVVPSATPRGGLQSLSGTVLETVPQPDSTFVHLRTAAGKQWVLVPPTKPAVGSSVTYYELWPVAVEEVGFRRRFEDLLMGQLAPPGGVQ